MSTTVLIILVLVILLFGGGYYGYGRYGYQGLGGIVGLILIILVILFLTGTLGGVRAQTHRQPVPGVTRTPVTDADRPAERPAVKTRQPMTKSLQSATRCEQADGWITCDNGAKLKAR